MLTVAYSLKSFLQGLQHEVGVAAPPAERRK